MNSFHQPLCMKSSHLLLSSGFLGWMHCKLITAPKNWHDVRFISTESVLFTSLSSITALDVWWLLLHLFAAGRECPKAAEILQHFQPVTARTLKPIATLGDGNCLFRAVSMALFSTEEHHLLLRLLALIEAVWHQEDYDVGRLVQMAGWSHG